MKNIYLNIRLSKNTLNMKLNEMKLNEHIKTNSTCEDYCTHITHVVTWYNIQDFHMEPCIFATLN